MSRDWNGDGKITPADRAVDYAVFKEIYENDDKVKQQSKPKSSTKSKADSDFKGLVAISFGTVLLLTYILPIPNTWTAAFFMVLTTPIFMFIYAKIWGKTRKKK